MKTISLARLALAAAAVTALTALTTRASASPAVPPPPYARHVCPDGLEVLVVENHATPLMTVEIAVHNGAMAEPPEYNGLSHLYEHMFFKGNKVLPDQLTYFARLRELGMVFNGTTDDERVNYFFTTTSDHYADAMAFMRDSITSPLFDAKELERERVVVTGEMDRDESDPGFHLWRAIEERVFWKYPSRHDALGNRKTVLSTTPSKMRTIQHRYYVPNNSVLVVTGDVHAEQVFADADKLYAGWAKADDPFVKFPLVKDPPIRKSEVVVVAQPVDTFHATVDWQGPGTIGPKSVDTYTADLLGTLVSDPGSRFQKALVDSGACVGASFSWATRRQANPVELNVEAPPGGGDACVKTAMAELPKMANPDYFRDDELENAAHRLDVDAAKGRETTDSYAHMLTTYWAMATLDYYRSYSENIHQVNRASIAHFLDTYIKGKPFVMGVLESPKLAETMTKAHLEELVGIGGSSAAKGGT
jgi:zinc protease